MAVKLEQKKAVVLLQAVRIGGKVEKKGAKLTLPKSDANFLIGYKKAEPVEKKTEK